MTRRAPSAEVAPPAPLAVGAEAWCLVYRPVGRGDKGRAVLEGCARVRVVAIDGDDWRVVVTLASGAIVVGRELVLLRRALYAVRDRTERLAFGAEVDRFWGPAAHRQR